MSIFKTAVRWWLLGSIALAGLSYFVWLYTADGSSANNASGCAAVVAAADEVSASYTMPTVPNYTNARDYPAAQAVIQAKVHNSPQYHRVTTLIAGNPKCFDPLAVADARIGLKYLARH